MKLTFNQCKKIFEAARIMDYHSRLAAIYRATAEYTKDLAGTQAAEEFINAAAIITTKLARKATEIKYSLCKELAIDGREFDSIYFRIQNRYELSCPRYLVKQVSGFN